MFIGLLIGKLGETMKTDNAKRFADPGNLHIPGCKENNKKISRKLAAILIIDEKENLIRSSISVYILMGDFT